MVTSVAALSHSSFGRSSWQDKFARSVSISINTITMSNVMKQTKQNTTKKNPKAEKVLMALAAILGA